MMRILRMKNAGKNFTYKWPPNEKVTYKYFVEYVMKDEDGEHDVTIGYGKTNTYGRKRARIIVWIDGRPDAEFLGADDFEQSGDVLSEIKVPGKVGERMCKYPDESIPARYAMFNVEGLQLRVKGKGVHGAWAVVVNVAEHNTLIALAALRRLERKR